MPDFTLPGIYIEETPTGPRTIAGVDSTVAAFVGSAHAGPCLQAACLTSLKEYEITFGAGKPLDFAKSPAFPNYLWHAARVFFEEGGRRLWIVRVAREDNLRPSVEDYAAGLKVLEEIPEIAAVAAPGSSAGYPSADSDAPAVMDLLVEHAQKMRYRIAVLDSPDGLPPDQLRKLRTRLESAYAALFAPWLRSKDPLSGGEILLPPSGFLVGLLARVDLARGVHLPPTNETLKATYDVEVRLPQTEMEVLTRAGINFFRLLKDGIRLWGTRTLSSEPEQKYLHLRRYLNYLERSIDEGIQWVVFQKSTPALWTNLRFSLENFLYAEWRKGALVGSKPEEAYFVRCDRTTMTQADIDNGRLICLIGVALLKPAEFTIFRIAQHTAG